MNLLLGWREETIKLNDTDSLIFQAKTLSREAMLLVTPFIGISSEDASLQVMAIEGYKLQGLAEQILKDHAKDFVGITINNKPLTIELLVNEATLVQLCGSIVTRLIEISSMTKAIEGKLDGQSGQQNSEESLKET